MFEENDRQFSVLMNALADSVSETRDEDILVESQSHGWSAEQTRNTLLDEIRRFKADYPVRQQEE